LAVLDLSSAVISEFHAIWGAITSIRGSTSALVSWMPPP